MCGSLFASHVPNTIKQLKKSINHTIEITFLLIHDDFEYIN